MSSGEEERLAKNKHKKMRQSTHADEVVLLEERSHLQLVLVGPHSLLPTRKVHRAKHQHRASVRTDLHSTAKRGGIRWKEHFFLRFDHWPLGTSVHMKLSSPRAYEGQHLTCTETAPARCVRMGGALTLAR